MMLYLDRDQVQAALHWETLIPAMKEALIAFSAGQVIQPVRQTLTVEEEGGFFLLMPAISQAMGVKLVTFYPGNAERDLHTHHAMIMLFERATGVPLAVMDGGLITEMRTAAVSAVATDLLAAPEARVLAILGSGVQARSHIAALGQVRDFDEVRIWSRTPAHAEVLAAEVGARAVADAREAVSGADVIVTATPATEPILEGAWLEPGAHVNAVGYAGAQGRELDSAAMQGVVYVDSRAGAEVEAGDVTFAGAEIHAELGEALAGGKEARVGEITIFESLGLAIEDVAAAQLVYDSVRRDR
ncbi:MAG TPA: ornithine cyclodeaminase family protein [Alphaproteobacteria bacterium]|nr:ornithine cyclodeaminase family protein [Alphaproteobacteria bacterium]MDP6271710.1 ornithine cyclodeaminase family protein [Alphaproteobacteria bacterium]HJM51606.1 ornithine cyclodeaminase family protein [Alphaproteobacteria bacterium]